MKNLASHAVFNALLFISKQCLIFGPHVYTNTIIYTGCPKSKPLSNYH